METKKFTVAHGYSPESLTNNTQVSHHILVCYNTETMEYYMPVVAMGIGSVDHENILIAEVLDIVYSQGNWLLSIRSGCHRTIVEATKISIINYVV